MDVLTKAEAFPHRDPLSPPRAGRAFRIVNAPPTLPLSRKVPGFTRALRRLEPWLTGFALVLGWAVAVRSGLQLLIHYS